MLSCPFVVQRRSVPTTFYVRAAPEEDEEAIEGLEEEATAEPTATESPWPQGPDYAVPASSGSQVESPAYGAPQGSGVSVQSPSYGIPYSAPTPDSPQ